jgi:hypothetical protein
MEHIGIESTPAAGYLSVPAMPPLHFQLLWMAVHGRLDKVGNGRDRAPIAHKYQV